MMAALPEGTRPTFSASAPEVLFSGIAAAKATAGGVACLLLPHVPHILHGIHQRQLLPALIAVSHQRLTLCWVS